MGPSGSGKCVTGDAEVLTSQGLMPIKDLVQNPRNVYAFTDKFSEECVTTTFSREVDELIRLKTRNGKSITLTLEHPLFTICDEGFTEVIAKNLKIGDRIATPRKLSIPMCKKDLRALETLAEHPKLVGCLDASFRSIMKVRGITRKYLSKKYNRARVDGWIYNGNNVPLHILAELGLLDMVVKVKLPSTDSSKAISVPGLTENVAELLGYVSGDGWLDKSGVRVANIDETIKSRILELFKEEFAIDGSQDGEKVTLNSRALRIYFSKVFRVPTRKKSWNITMSNALLMAPISVLSRYLRALNDCDGFVDKKKKEISLTLASKKLIKQLQTAYLRYGIVATVRSVRKRATNSNMRARTYWTLSISGLDNIKIYGKDIGFLHPMKRYRLEVHMLAKISDTNVDTIPISGLYRTARRTLGISNKWIKRRTGKDFWHIEGTKREPTVGTAKIMLSELRKRQFELISHEDQLPNNLSKIGKELQHRSNSEVQILCQEIQCELQKRYINSEYYLQQLEYAISSSEHLFWDSVTDIELIRKRTKVYDITVPRAHNFIANNVIIHNSTAMNMIGCLDIPTKGEVYLHHHDISHLTESNLAQIRGKEIGFVFQKFNLINTLTAKENIMLPMMFQNVSFSEREDKAEKVLRMVDLGDRMDHKPSELSGGQQQRVAIARALALSPEVILADEPTGNLDSKTGGTVMDFLKKLHKEKGTTIVMVTHDSRVAEHADRVEYLKDGQIVRKKDL
ncbi:ATP-binding cassette domain-containing protein [Candidatus Woesearchaeota archaeon]|nr:ATP-binding cassette domain-containing protein [Candidatus Woesearchaeota archaeon]